MVAIIKKRKSERKTMLKLIFGIIIIFSLAPGQLLFRPNFTDEPSKRALIPIDAVINYLPLTKVYDITEGPDFYYLATNAGIWRYHKYNREWSFPVTTAQGLPENTVQRIYFQVSRDMLYAETPGYRCFYNPTWKLWQVFPKNITVPFINGVDIEALYKEMAGSKAEKIKRINSLPRQASIPNDRQYTMRADGALISPEGETFEMTFSFTSFREDIIFVIDNFGVGLSTEYDVTFDLYRLSVPDVRLRDLFIDGDLFWFGGLGRKGFNSFGAITVWPSLKESWTQYYKQNSSAFAQSFSVNRFAGDADDLFAATDNGILQYQNGNDEWLTLPNSANKSYSNITRITKMDRQLWLGTNDGLALYDLDAESFIYNQNPLRLTRIYDIEANDDEILVAANEGIFRFANRGTSGPESVNYLGTIVGGLPEVLFSSKKELWIGTAMGWITYNKKKRVWSGQLLSNFLLRGPIVDIAANNRHAFIALSSGIIHWNRKKDTYRWLGSELGFPPGAIRRVALDGNAVWCITDGGAAQIFFKAMKY